MMSISGPALQMLRPKILLKKIFNGFSNDVNVTTHPVDAYVVSDETTALNILAFKI